MDSPLIVLAGLPGSGKTTASKLLSEKGFSVVYMGFLTKKILIESGLELNQSNEEYVRRYLRRKYGKSIYARIATDEIKKYFGVGKQVILEGLRSGEELVYLKKQFRNLKVIFITAPKELRYKRLMNRKVRPITRAEAEKRDNEEINILGINKVRRMADFILTNEVSKPIYYEQIKRLTYDPSEDRQRN